MRRWGMVIVGLVAAAALLALTAASAVAAAPIAVTETTDAPLSFGASTCESTDLAKGCTLRAAVELADTEGEVTIDVPEGTYIETESEPTLVVKDDAEVTIAGAGAGKTIIEGEEKGAVFAVEADSYLALDGVTVRHGEYSHGGGVYVGEFAGLTVEGSTITENTATEDGGGIYTEPVAYVALKGSTISDNTAPYYGGGIDAYYDNYLTVKESKVTENSAGESGGGLSIYPDSTVSIAQSTIAKNSARYEGGGVDEEIYYQESCAGHASGHSALRRGAVRKALVEEESEPALSISQSTVEGNTASEGGGIYIYQREGGCAVAKSAGTAATRAARPSVRAQAAGLLELEPSVSISQSTIASNRAEAIEEDEEERGGYGGGIYEEGSFDPIVNSTIADNFATYDGGGVAIAHEAAAALISDTVFDNTVEPFEEEEEEGTEDSRPGLKSFRHAMHKLKSAHHAVRHDVETRVGPGNNLATEADADAYALLRNTIVAEPNASTENCEGYFESLVEHAGYNLDYPSRALSAGTLDSCGMSSEEHDLVGERPGLNESEGLAGNGGPTDTIALLASSPAIGFVPIEDCDEAVFGPGAVDQRSLARPGIPGKGCDIGAYEYQQPPAKIETKVETKPVPPATATTSVLPFISSTPPPQCTSLRDITIHIQNVKQFGIVSAVVSVDGHNARTLRGKHLRTAINLRGLPQGTFTVEIVARTRSGRILRGKRVYHTCHTKLPGHSYLRL